MATNSMDGTTAPDRLGRRYETTEKKCPACGYVDHGANWTSRTDGRQVVYRHVRPVTRAANTRSG